MNRGKRRASRAFAGWAYFLLWLVVGGAFAWRIVDFTSEKIKADDRVAAAIDRLAEEIKEGHQIQKISLLN